jgi:hypothetical protein
MKLIVLIFFCIASFPNTSYSANPTLTDEYGTRKFPAIRGAEYKLKKSVLTITEKSFKLINRTDNGEHATKLLKGKFPVLSIKFALEKLYNSHDLINHNKAGVGFGENLLIEFEGNISNLIISHICRGKHGNYLSLSIPDIFYAKNFTINTLDGEKNIKKLIIETDPSTGLLLQKKLLWGAVGNYWRFFLKRIDYDKKFKVQGLINFAEQDLNPTLTDEYGTREIKSLVVTIVIVKISPIPHNKK